MYETIPGGGNSYVDDDREPGRGYRYEIVAVKDGRRASTVFIDKGGVQGGPAGTGDPTDASGLPPAVAAALDRTFDLLSLRPFEQVLATVARLDDPTASGLTFTAERPDSFASDIVSNEYACPGGGTFTIRDRGEDAELIDRLVDAQGCTIGPITLSLRGSVFASEFDDGSRSRFLNATEISLADARDGSRVDVTALRTAIGEDGIRGNVRTDSLSVTRAGGTYSAESFSLGQGPDNSATTITVGGENVSNALAGNARLRSREALVIGPDNLPTSGAIAIVQIGTNAEAYDINAASGNPDTFLFTATIDGVTTTYDVPWSEQRSIGRPRLDGVDVGF